MSDMYWLVIWSVAILTLLGAFFAALRNKMSIAIPLMVVGIAAAAVLIVVQD